VHQNVEHGGLQKAWIFELAGCGGTGDSEDSRSDDDADAQKRERPRTQRPLQSMRRLVGVRDQLIDRFGPEQRHANRSL
jgi:hypothetical protein